MYLDHRVGKVIDFPSTICCLVAQVSPVVVSLRPITRVDVTALSTGFSLLEFVCERVLSALGDVAWLRLDWCPLPGCGGLANGW